MFRLWRTQRKIIERTPFFIVWTEAWERNGEDRFWPSRTENLAFLGRILAFLFWGDALRFYRRTIPFLSTCSDYRIELRSLPSNHWIITSSNERKSTSCPISRCFWLRSMICSLNTFSKNALHLAAFFSDSPSVLQRFKFCVAFSVVWTPLRSFWHSLNTPQISKRESILPGIDRVRHSLNIV